MNDEFLKAVFGRHYAQAHVTSFTYDPAAIPSDKHLMCWRGDYYSRHQFEPGSNQYFTISTFAADEKGMARRRKALFERTHCIVLDDVKEKLHMDEVSKLPEPSWILETSSGSEQWGYILHEPCTNRFHVENLLDGLVANGLAPDGRDPGMKGVTRYVRLPDGYNTKANRWVDGQPFKCRLLLWQPFNTVTMEQLAAPFHVNLDAERRETRVDGAAAVDDHPLLDLIDIIRIKEVRSDGRFDITCPWVDEHTGADDSGTAVFTNKDGTIGFKCHHGACQDRTGNDLLNLIEGQYQGFRQQLAAFQALRVLAEVAELEQAAPAADQPPAPVASTTVEAKAPAPAEQADAVIMHLFDAMRVALPESDERLTLASKILEVVDGLPVISQVRWHGQIRDTMRWSKVEFTAILKDLRAQWYAAAKADVNFYDSVIYIAEANQFYDRAKRIFYTPEAYQNAHMHLDPEARKEALAGGRVMKVDKLDYAPKMPAVFNERGVIYGNSWSDVSELQGEPGDAKYWLEHFEVIGWGAEKKKHMLQHMAFTLRHPEQKINHMLVLGSDEGCGKDFLLYPLVKALGDNATTISGDELLENFNDYLLGTKFLLVNETELADHKDAQTLNARLKPLAAAPPERLRVNQKGVKKVEVRNILSVAMTTNSRMPFRLSGQSRRVYALWSDLNTRDGSGQISQGWKDYWGHRWNWMQTEGVKHCIHYLRTQVDLSDFNPGEAPPMTEFLQEIQDASKPSNQQTLEAFIDERVMQFSCDLVTAKDANDCLRKGDMVRPDLMYARPEWFTPVKTGMLLSDTAGVQKLQAFDGGKSRRLYCLRNVDKYQALSQSDLWREYERQMAVQQERDKNLRLVSG